MAKAPKKGEIFYGVELSGRDVTPRFFKVVNLMGTRAMYVQEMFPQTQKISPAKYSAEASDNPKGWKQVRVKLDVDAYGDTCFTIEEYIVARKWDGQPIIGKKY